MAYYYVDDVEGFQAVTHMLRVCSEYFSVPTVVDGEELKEKLKMLNELYVIWTEDKLDDSSYPSGVYKLVCEMFSKNVFRRSPLFSYILEDEINAELMWEFKQLSPVYKVFTAFVNLKGFDGEKLAPYVDETFISALTRRLQDSCVEAEREGLKQILSDLFEKALYLREYVLLGIINSLINYGPMSINGGVNELLEVFQILMCHKMVGSPTIFKVLSPLVKRNGLCHYAVRLQKCFEAAARYVDARLPARFVDDAIGNWQASAADVPSLCRTLAALYFDMCGPESRPLVRGRLVGHVADKLRQLAADASAAVCLAYAEICGRLLDDEVAGREHVADMERVAEGLIAVHTKHRDYGCVERVDRLLRRLIDGGADGRRSMVGDACRLSVVEALAGDRLRTMDERLIDKEF